MNQLDHPLWNVMPMMHPVQGMGGWIGFVINSFIESVKRETPYALDVYDSATLVCDYTAK